MVRAALRGGGVLSRHRGQQLLRQASLKAVRADKEVNDLADSDRAAPAKPARGKRASAASSARKTAATPQVERVPQTVLPEQGPFPGDGYMKQDVWDYYSAVMDHLLPEVINRPLSIIRCPAGTGKPCFFQKHHTAGLELVDSVKLKEDSGINAHYLVVRDAASLLELVSSMPWSSIRGKPRGGA